MYSADMDTLILVGLSIASGVVIGLVTKRPLLFIVSIFIAPMAIAGGFYLADLIHLRSIGHSSNESWAGLVIPFLSAGGFLFLAPTAFGVAGLKWFLSRRRNKSGQNG
jgi:hypothetical protein